MISKESVVLIALMASTSSAFSVAPAANDCRFATQLPASADSADEESCASRRTLFQGAIATVFALPSIASAGETSEVRGTQLTPFNSLTFQYRGFEYGGLKASDLDEPSVSYKDFYERLQKGEVEFVEFMAPHGDAAYVTFKGDKPIRIGEGYPIEQFDGWSSPAFAVRTVKDAGVPYKFTVPALRSYN